MSIYYDPKDYGFKLFGELDRADLCYEFEILAVFEKVDTGELFWATDSG